MTAGLLRWARLWGALAMIAGRNATAQDTARQHQGTGVILGVVTDSALRPVAGADVAIALSGVHVAADARGRFQIVNVPTGDYLLTVRRVGFRAVVASVSVTVGDTTRPAFTLNPSIAELDPVSITDRGVSAKFREFEQRRKSGNGEFFDQRYIEARNVVSTVDILREARAIRVSWDGASYFALSGREWRPCPMAVYLDGMALSNTDPTKPFDLNQLPSPKEIMAIEVYAGAASVPLWLAPEPPAVHRSCGAVLLWTRDGSISKL